MEDNDYLIPLFRDRDFPRQNTQLAKSKVAPKLVSAIGYFCSILFSHYDMVIEEGDNHRLQEPPATGSYMEILEVYRYYKRDQRSSSGLVRKYSTLHPQNKVAVEIGGG